MTETADPPGMTDAEFKVIREYLGLTGDWIAAHVGVDPRTVRRWEQGIRPIPDMARLAIEQLAQDTSKSTNSLIEELRDLPEPAILTYRGDEDYQAHHPESPFSASWHRAVIARVAQEVPALSIVFRGPPVSE